MEDEYLEVRVTKVGARWHCRMIDKQSGAILDEVACSSKRDINYFCRLMLHWHHRMGHDTPMTEASRKRCPLGEPVGRIWAIGA